MGSPPRALVLAVVLLLVGCGGSTPTLAELQTEVEVARDRTDAALERITRARSEEDLLTRMDDAAETIADAAADVEDAGAPEGFEREAGTLVDALGQLAYDVQATAEQIRDPEFRELVTGTRGLSLESWDEVNGALAALRERGLVVAPLERH